MNHVTQPTDSAGFFAALKGKKPDIEEGEDEEDEE